MSMMWDLLGLADLYGLDMCDVNGRVILQRKSPVPDLEEMKTEEEADQSLGDVAS